MKEYGKLKTGPGGISCPCCSPRIGKFGRRARAQTKRLCRRYIRRTTKITEDELED